MTARRCLFLLPLLLAGCGLGQSADAPADAAATDVSQATSPPLDTAAADEMVKAWEGDALPGSLDQLQRRTYTEFERSMLFGFERITPPPGHYLPSGSGHYTMDGKTLDFTAAYPAGDPRHGRWTIANVQLLGTLKKPDGQVYVVKKTDRRRLTESDPAAGLRASDPTSLRYPPPEVRPLTWFERDALERFRHRNGHVETRAEPDSLHVVGAIRAVNADCMKCHKVEKYALLGAFVYDLKRAK